MNPFEESMDQEIHQHLEIDKGDTTITFSVFDTPSTGDIEIDIHRTDNSGKLTFNSSKMFLTEDEFRSLSYFLQRVQSTISIRNTHKFVEDLRTMHIDEENKQADFIDVDDDHVRINKPNLFRDVIDSQTIKNKMRASKSYSKKFYAAMCNTDVYKDGDAGEYGYSWRSAGGLVADILGEGDYLNWYCSGNEGFVDDEVADDLKEIGWTAVPIERDTSARKQTGLF
jgi:hypothetical protein